MTISKLSFVIVIMSLLLVASTKRQKTVIGILANPEPGYSEDPTTSKIYATYVRWLEAAGAKTVVLVPWMTTDELDEVLPLLNGVLWQGGARTIRLGGSFENTGDYILKKIIEFNKNNIYYPLWAACLGFEMLNVLVGEDDSIIDRGFKAHNIVSPLIFNSTSIELSRLHKDLNENDLKALREKNITAHFHRKGITPESFQKNEKLTSFFNLIASAKDLEGRISIEIVEAKDYPIYATQFHPEKALFDVKATDKVPVGYEAMKINYLYAAYLVKEAQRNKNFLPEDLYEKYRFIDTYRQLPEPRHSVFYYFYYKDELKKNNTLKFLENK